MGMSCMLVVYSRFAAALCHHSLSSGCCMYRLISCKYVQVDKLEKIIVIQYDLNLGWKI